MRENCNHLAVAEQMIAHYNAQDADAYVALIGVPAISMNSDAVTLNLFQGPSGRKLGASRAGAMPRDMIAIARSGCGAKWTLKQVQGDDCGYGIA